MSLFSETERTWKRSIADGFVKLFSLFGVSFTIQGTVSYCTFKSVIGAIILSGNLPIRLLFRITQGLVFLISAPIVGSRFTSHISFCFT